MDYLYRARIKSNYEDPTMYSESPEDAAALLALVRNTQKLTVMLCAFVVAALRRTIDEPAQNQLVEMSVFNRQGPFAQRPEPIGRGLRLAGRLINHSARTMPGRMGGLWESWHRSPSRSGLSGFLGRRRRSKVETADSRVGGKTGWVPVGVVTHPLKQSRVMAVSQKQRPPLDRQGPYGRDGLSTTGWDQSSAYKAMVNLITKVLDFVQLGGPTRTELRTFRWEVRI